jgi:hypothetical protein
MRPFTLGQLRAIAATLLVFEIEGRSRDQDSCTWGEEAMVEQMNVEAEMRLFGLYNIQL